MNRAFIPLFGLVLTAAAVIAAAVLYPHLPQTLPAHWDLNGHVNGYVHKPWGPFVFAEVLLGLTVVLTVAPLISPRRFEMEAFASSYRLIAGAVLGLIAWIDAVSTASWLGASLDPGRAGLAGFGLVLAVMGNVLGKVTPNFFVGVRTPWTIASPEVWRRTHRAAAWVFVGLGLLVGVGATVGAPIAAVLVPVIATAAGLVVYSYVLYRRIEPQARRR